MLNPISFVKHAVDLFDQRICKLSDHEDMDLVSRVTGHAFEQIPLCPVSAFKQGLALSSCSCMP